MSIHNILEQLFQDKQLLYSAFPTLSQNLTPMAAAYGLQSLDPPLNFKVVWLGTFELVEITFSSLMAPLDLDKKKCLAASTDAEWKISWKSGVFIFQVAPHSQPDTVFIIPVRLPCFSLSELKLTYLSFLNFTHYLHPCFNS